MKQIFFSLVIFLILSGCKKNIQQLHKESIVVSSAVTVNVKDYGAKGNGSHDDVQAFQDAEDYLRSIGGGILYVPNGTYIVSKPFYHRNNVTLSGNGDNSIIKNKVTQSGPGQFCIYIGNFTPSQYAECVHYDVNAITAGQNQVTLTGTGAQFFFAGQAILVDSHSGFLSADGHWKPYEAFINRVTAITGNTITLEDAVTVAIPDAQIAPTNKFSQSEDTNKVYICQRPVIQNIRFESKGDWAMRFGVYKGLFQNISLKTTDVIPGNGFSWCVFKNITASFSQKVIEMAMYSHNTTVDTLTATWYNGAADPADKPLLKLGENQRDCSFSHLTINSGTSAANFNNVIRFDHAFNDTIRYSHFTCSNVPGAGVSLDGSDAATFITGNNTLDNIFDLGGGDSYIEFQMDNGAQVINNIISNNTFNGGANQNIKGNIGNNTVSNNIFN